MPSAWEAVKLETVVLVSEPSSHDVYDPKKPVKRWRDTSAQLKLSEIKESVVLLSRPWMLSYLSAEVDKSVGARINKFLESPARFFPLPLMSLEEAASVNIPTQADVDARTPDQVWNGAETPIPVRQFNADEELRFGGFMGLVPIVRKREVAPEAEYRVSKEVWDALQVLAAATEKFLAAVKNGQGGMAGTFSNYVIGVDKGVE